MAVSLARWLVGAFLVVVAAFLAAAAFTHHVSAEVDVAADGIAENAAPSIELLGALRGDVRHLQYLLDDYVDLRSEGMVAERGELDAAALQVQRDMGAYIQIPPFLGEKEMWEELLSSLHHLSTATQKAIAAAELGAGQAALSTVKGEVHPAAHRAIQTIKRLTSLNARNGHDLAITIKRARRRGVIVGSIVDVLCGTLAIALALAMRHYFRRHLAAQAANTRLLEEKSRELELFAGRAAHDLRNPIGAARMIADLIDRLTIDERARKLSRQSLRSLTRADGIINDLLDFARAGARPEPGATSPVADVTRDAIADLQPVATNARIELTVEPVPACQVGCSDGVLTSMISNLVCNAIVHMGDAAVRRVNVRVVERGALVRVEVADTGPGVAADQQAELFEPFVRGVKASGRGVGLGLATAKRFAERHGGAIGVRSDEGNGSLFWFELPCGAAGGSASARHHSPPVRSATG